ncbi:MAG: hypothetical protein M3N32_05980 [Actinomycetota bacterium]|nr:hypothetical protein [Actinomycetota bacterium]
MLKQLDKGQRVSPLNALHQVVTLLDERLDVVVLRLLHVPHGTQRQDLYGARDRVDEEGIELSSAAAGALGDVVQLLGAGAGLAGERPVGVRVGPVLVIHLGRRRRNYVEPQRVSRPPAAASR